MFLHTHTHTHTHIHTYMHTYIHTDIYIYKYIHTHLYMYIYTHTYIHIYIHTYVSVRKNSPCYHMDFFLNGIFLKKSHVKRWKIKKTHRHTGMARTEWVV